MSALQKTDRELLELAAKASGINVIRSRLDDPLFRDFLVSNGVRNPHHENGPWNPLEDDGDALRLAVKLQISIHNEHLQAGSTYCTRVDSDDPFGDVLSEEACDGDGETLQESDYAATRRAIVIAAAQLAESKERE